jgi:hypothetical protein
MELYAKQISCTAAILNLQTSKKPKLFRGSYKQLFDAWISEEFENFSQSESILKYKIMI